MSWLLLRGRCRTCGEPISARYPLVELAGGILFAIVGWWIAGMDPPDWYALPGYLLFVWTLLVVTVIDARTRRIPNRLTYPLTPALAVLLCGAALLNGDPAQALRTLAGGVIAGAVLLVLALINPRGMGMGDVKFAPFLGMGLAYLGWDALAVGIFGAFLIGGVDQHRPAGPEAARPQGPAARSAPTSPPARWSGCSSGRPCARGYRAMIGIWAHG